MTIRTTVRCTFQNSNRGVRGAPCRSESSSVVGVCGERRFVLPTMRRASGRGKVTRQRTRGMARQTLGPRRGDRRRTKTPTKNAQLQYHTKYHTPYHGRHARCRENELREWLSFLNNDLSIFFTTSWASKYAAVKRLPVTSA
eukprot:scaffold310_cov168-Amphora_coffeaeformis.AAC.21